MGKPLTAAQIKSVCDATKSSVFCAVSLVNDPDKAGKRFVKVRLYKANGSFIKEISSGISHVKEADYVSIKIA